MKIIHTNGAATAGRIDGVTITTDISNGAFSIRATPDDAGTKLTITGRPAPEQVLRLLGRAGALDSPEADGSRIDVRIKTTKGADRYLYTADMRHRLLFSRTWDRPGNRTAWYGLNPFLADTTGVPDKVPTRPSLRNALGALATRGPVARIDVMNVFTLRTADAASLPADPADRLADPDVEREVLTAADLVLLAWGAKIQPRHEPVVKSFLKHLGTAGVQSVLRAKDGQILTSGTPAQPTHPRMGGYRDVTLVAAPESWLDGGPLEDGRPSDPQPAPSPVSAVIATPPAPPAPPDVRAANTSRDEGWRNQRPSSLRLELEQAGLDTRRAEEVSTTLRGWADDGRFDQAIEATKKLLRGQLPILLDDGSTELALWQVLPRTLRVTRSPFEIAQSVLVGAVCSGGVGEFASWLECTRPGRTARHKDRDGLYPVPGIESPGDARKAYARLIGSRKEADARKARGHAGTLNGKDSPSPAERFGW